MLQMIKIDAKCLYSAKLQLGRLYSNATKSETANNDFTSFCLLLDRNLMKFLLLFFFSLLIILTSCGGKKADGLTSKIAMSQDSALVRFSQLSPVDGAKFYLENRKEYKYMDGLYKEYIIPNLYNCNYYEIREIYKILSGTPCSKNLLQLKENSKNDYLLLIKRDLEKHEQIELSSVEANLFPYIKMGMDSLIDEDVEDILDKYSGGFMNYRKLHFFFGRGRQDFKDMFWEKMDTTKYKNYVRNASMAFLSNIASNHTKYYYQITGRKCQFALGYASPNLTIGLSPKTLRHIVKYTKEEKKGMINEFIRDYVVQAAIDCASGGLGAVYSVGTMAYDIKGEIEDIKKQKLSSDDLIKLACQHDLSYQISRYYLPLCSARVKEQISKSNQSLYNKIKETI